MFYRFSPCCCVSIVVIYLSVYWYVFILFLYFYLHHKAYAVDKIRDRQSHRQTHKQTDWLQKKWCKSMDTKRYENNFYFLKIEKVARYAGYSPCRPQFRPAQREGWDDCMDVNASLKEKYDQFVPDYMTLGCNIQII